jgi:hypothetical protein
MVQIRDDGVFDAPVDKLWKYVNDQMLHNHASFKTTKVLDQKGNAMVVEADVANMGKPGTHKETWKFVWNPPKGFDMEYLTGPMQGSRHTHTYTPMGNRTKVEVVGDFKMQGMDEAMTKKAVLQYFAQVFEEDTAALRKYK